MLLKTTDFISQLYVLCVCVHICKHVYKCQWLTCWVFSFSIPLFIHSLIYLRWILSLNLELTYSATPAHRLQQPPVSACPALGGLQVHRCMLIVFAFFFFLIVGFRELNSGPYAYIADFCPLSYFANLHNETHKVQQRSASCVEIMSFFCSGLWTSISLLAFRPLSLRHT